MRYDWPRCTRCRRRRAATRNGRLDGRPAAPTAARYWCRDKGTLGLMRHLCVACQQETGDPIEADLGEETLR